MKNTYKIESFKFLHLIIIALVFYFNTEVTLAQCTAPTGLVSDVTGPGTASFSWNAVANAQSYTIRYFDNDILPRQFQYSTSTNPFQTINTLVPATNYAWEVRTNCSGSSSGYSTRMYFSTPAGVPSCTKPINLSSSNVGISNATLAWDTVSCESIRIRYYDNDITPRQFSYVNISNTASYLLSNLLSNTNYAWEVATFCEGTSSGYSATSYFTTLEGVPSCTKPVNLVSSNIGTNSATLGWDTVSCESIRIRYYNNDIIPRQFSYANISNTTSFTLTNLTDNINYGWEVASFCDGVSSGYSKTSYFTTPAACYHGFPYVNNFSTQINQDCWTISQIEGEGIWEYATTMTSPSLDPAQGTELLLFRAGEFAFGTTSRIVSPLFDLSDETLINPYLSVSRSAENTNLSKKDRIEVFVSIDNGNSWTEALRSINRPVSGVSIPEWRTFFLDLTPFLEETQFRIAINAVSENGSNLAIDQVAIYPSASCAVPVNLQSSNVGVDSVTVSWNPVEGATNYKVRYAQAATPTVFTHKDVTQTSTKLTNLVPDTPYIWWVRSDCGSETFGYQALYAQFTTGEGIPQCTYPHNRISEIIDSISVQLTWDTIIADGIRIRYYDNDVFPREFYYATISNSTSYLLTGLTAGINYAWEVSAICNNVNTGYSPTSYFYIPPSCVPPTGLESSVINSSSVALSWDPVNSESLRIRYFDDAISPRVFYYSNIPNATSDTLTGLTEGITYGWAVASICDGINTGYSQNEYFTTPSGSRISNSAFENSRENAEVLIYPNPSENFVNLRLLSDTDNTSIRLIDSYGNNKNILINRIDNSNEFLLDIQQLVKGIYFIIINGEAYKLFKN